MPALQHNEFLLCDMLQFVGNILIPANVRIQLFHSVLLL